MSITEFKKQFAQRQIPAQLEELWILQEEFGFESLCCGFGLKQNPLQLLSFDTEPMVDWDEVSFYRDEDEEPTEAHEEYLNWFHKYNVASDLSDADAIVAAAQSKWSVKYKTWISQFVQE